MHKFINILSGLLFSLHVPFFLFLLTIGSIFASISPNECEPNDFLYQYSPCDETGQRWRYAVPKSHKLQCKNVPPPVNGLNCSFFCPAGNFLDMEMQKCKSCPPGKYSLGDGVRYEQLEKMPPGFTVENFPDETDQPIQSTYENQQEEEKETTTRTPEYCSNQVGWTVQNGELRYTPTPCISKLSISLNLVRNGYIEFFYKMPKNSRSLVTLLQVRNAQCQSYGDQRSMFFQTTHLVSPTSLDEDIAVGEEGFRIRKLHIRTGQNLITWTVAANNRDLTTLADIIYVPKIDIFGLAFTPSCSNCPAGTFSQGGAQKCQSCQANTFSHNGASRCENCGPLEYSASKSSRCLRRPTCQKFDYYPVRVARCQNSSKFTTYKKIQPAVCVEGSRDASPTTSSESCGPCNAGMFRNTVSGECEYCKQEDEYSDDGITCKKCASNMVPEHGLFFTNWDVLPEQITSSCELITSDESGQLCSVSPAWLAMGNQVQSAQTRATGVALELNVKMESGFFNPLRMGGGAAKPTVDNPLGHISLDMQMECIDPSCQLYFVQEHGNSSIQNHFRVIAALNGNQRRRVFSYPIVDSRPTEFVIAFMRSGSALDKDGLTDKVTIYSLNITNVGDPISKRPVGGAANCVVCPSRDPVTKTCQPCPNGHYWLQEGLKCVKCPVGTALNLTSSRQGPDSCMACGPNLGSEDGSACSFSGRFELPSLDENIEVMKFDFSPLKNRTLTAEGIKVYAREGNSYFHSFNVSVMGEPVYCRDSFDSGSNKQTPLAQTTGSPSDADDAVFCRSAAIPAINGNNSGSSNLFNKVLYVSSTIISRKLAAITQNRSFRGFHLSNEQLEYDTSLSSTTRPIDVHLFYEPSSSSMGSRMLNCPNGTIGVVTLRCEPTAVKNPIVRLSRKCPDGTCDGCVFHVIVESSYACPICHPDDFEEIRGECINNIQKIHSIPSKHCVLSGAQNKQRDEACSSLSKNIKLILLSAALLIAVLAVTIVVFYQRNKSLEYRYMRIIEGKEPDNANSCGMQSDDDEEEDVSSHTRVFFGKKKNNYVVSVSRDPKTVKTDETAEFLSDSSDS